MAVKPIEANEIAPKARPNVAGAMASGLSTALLFAIVASSRSSMGSIIRDLRGEVPAFPSVLLSLPFVWLVGALFALTVGKDLFMDRGAKKAWWNTVIIFAAMVLGGIYLIGVFWPCVVLIERIE